MAVWQACAWPELEEGRQCNGWSELVQSARPSYDVGQDLSPSPIWLADWTTDGLRHFGSSALLPRHLRARWRRAAAARTRARRRGRPASGWRPLRASSAATARSSRPTSSTSSRPPPPPPPLPYLVFFCVSRLDIVARSSVDLLGFGSCRIGCGKWWTRSGWSASAGSPWRACSCCRPDASMYGLGSTPVSLT
jgi:hypothetical protein